jgi:hypothetical protein
MTKNTNKKNTSFCNTEGAQSAAVQDVNYSYYSRVLKEPFDSLAELAAAEEAYYAKQKAKEDAAAMKKADAQKVDNAFKALNAARKTYKEDFTQLTKEYADSLDNLKKAFELGKKDIHNKLAKAEEAYQVALKEFTDKHPEGFHLTLRDGDFETTISNHNTSKKVDADLMSIFDAIFNW